MPLNSSLLKLLMPEAETICSDCINLSDLMVTFEFLSCTSRISEGFLFCSCPGTMSEVLPALGSRGGTGDLALD